MKTIELILIFLHAMMLLCDITDGASPRAVAVVTVAVAVDELLQTNTPELPDSLGGGEREEVQPSPSPTACGCGCGKTGCQCGKAAMADKDVRASALALAANGLGGPVGALDTVVRAAHCSGVVVTPAVQDRPMLAIDDAALESVGQRDMIDVYAPKWCGNCPAWKRLIGTDGFNWIESDPPKWVTDVTQVVPAFTYKGRVLCNTPVGHTADSLRRAAGIGNAVKSVGAVNVGRIDGKAIRSLFDKIKAAKAGSVIQFEGASIVMPAKMANDLEISPERTSMQFTGQKPRLAYGSGWLAVSQPVGGIAVTRDRLTIGLDGFPDLVLRVE